MNVGYVRVSSLDQSEARQIESLSKYHIEKFFVDKQSGKNTDRPELQNMLDFVREGDTIYIDDFSRLARSTKDLLDLTDYLQQKNVNFVSLKENIDTTTPSGKLMLTMIGAIAEFERANILERQKEGIAIAKRNGVYKGRKKIVINDMSSYYERYRNHELSISGLAKELKISWPTASRLLKEFESSQQK